MPHSTTSIPPSDLQILFNNDNEPTALLDMDGRDINLRKLLLSNQSLITNAGIRINVDNPQWTWRDIIGDVAPKETGVGSPTRTIINGGLIAGEAFIQGDLCDFSWHIPHDWVQGTDMLWHVHIEHTGTTIVGNAVFDLFYKVGKRDGSFTTEKQLTITHATTNVTVTPRLSNLVYETPMSSAAGSATLVPTSAFEVDGIIKGTLRMTTLPTMGGGGKMFIHTADIHYQSLNVGTRLSAFPFY